jgi:RimJ/RimL family protein N-acetyltransferase
MGQHQSEDPSISLRELLPTDRDRLVSLANDEKVSRYLVYTFPYPYTKTDAEQGPIALRRKAKWNQQQ